MTGPDHSIRRELAELIPPLRRFARSLTGDRHDADDLVQIALERALSHAGQLQPGSNLKSWVFRIMKNAWLDELRTRSRRGKVVLPEASGDDVGSWSTDDELRLLEVLKVMQRLPESQRLVVGLVIVEGFSYGEAAEVLDIPVGTVTSRLARARDALAGMLDLEDDAP